MIQRKQIKSGSDTMAVAVDIANNMEAWRVDSQAKTEATLSRIVSNINKKDAERIARMADKRTIEIDNTQFGYGNKKFQGD